MKNNLYYPTLLIVFFLFGCQTDDSEPITEVNLDREGINGQVLAKITYSQDHFIEIYEFETGRIAISEELSLDSGIEPRNLSQIASSNDHSLVKIYKALADGNINERFVQNLKKAQIRADEFQRTKIEHSEAELTQFMERFGSESGNARVKDFDRTDCAPDFLNDNYSAQYFLDNFGPSTSFEVNANEVISIDVTDEIAYVAAAADYDVGATFLVARANSSLTAWIVDLDFFIQPRRVKSFLEFTGRSTWTKAEVIGLSPCSRVHYLENANFQ